MNKILVFTGTYNESENILRLINEVFESSNEVNLLVIDNSSIVFSNFKEKDSFVKVTFHFTALSLKRCLDISSKPKLLILPI